MSYSSGAGRADAGPPMTWEPDDYEAARARAVMFPPAEHRALAVGGPEARQFLQAHLTADVAELEVGHGVRAAMLSPKGQLLCIVRVLRRPGAYLLDAPVAGWSDLAAALHVGRVGWRVDLRERAGEQALISTVGATAPQACGLHPESAPGDHRIVRLSGHVAIAVRTELGADLLVRRAACAALVRVLTDRGVRQAHAGLWDVLRLEAGIPEFGRDITNGTLPLEAGLVPDVVELEGRVYPGLQTTLRQHHRGTVHRRLRQLRSAAPVRPGDLVTDDEGRELGRVSSGIVSPTYGPLALATLRASARPGDHVLIGDVPARVFDP